MSNLEFGLFAKLLYDIGMRIMEGGALWIKDLDFEHFAIIREGGGAY